MSDWHLQAFHDPKAEPVADMWLQSSSQLDEYLPKLAEKAGLGKYNMRGSANGRFFFDNGEIQAKKHYNNQ
jgi:hypothetical protein